MKKIALVLCIAAITSPAFAADVNVQVRQLGSGTPAAIESKGTEGTLVLPDGVYHAPQYLPGFPTAATIWPRVVEVDCEELNGVVSCAGFNWTPELGRGEYLFISPKIKNQPQPSSPVPVIIYKEVDVKKKAE